MKFLLFLLFAIVSTLASANSDLIGAWSMCDQDDENFDYEHVVEFRLKGVEDELHAFRLKSDKPCGGKILSVISRKWSYKTSSGKYKSVLKNTYAMVLQERLVSEFNKMNFCNTKAWIKDKLVDCTKNFFPEFEDKVGLKTSHSYVRKDNQLLVMPKTGDTVIYNKLNF